MAYCHPDPWDAQRMLDVQILGIHEQCLLTKDETAVTETKVRLHTNLPDEPMSYICSH